MLFLVSKLSKARFGYQRLFELLQGNKFAMYIILPDDKAGLDEVLKNMDPIKLRELIWFLGETWVEVILPRFKFDFTADLKNILTKVNLSRTN